MKYLLPIGILFLALSLVFSCQVDGEQQEKENPPLLVNNNPPPPPPPKVEKVVFDSANYEWKDGYIQLDWKDLSRVEFNEGVINDTLVLIPTFHDSIKILENKPIQIRGYYIEFGEKTGKLHFISAYPMSQCFFCGAAGPETVMDVMSQNVYRGFKTDDIVSFRGRLTLNDSNLNFMNFILKEAELKND